MQVIYVTTYPCWSYKCAFPSVKCNCMRVGDGHRGRKLVVVVVDGDGDVVVCRQYE